MEHIVTYMGEDFMPLTPDENKIHMGDIAHALSLLCRANGHISHFFSIAQHSINCANEGKARGYSKRLQLACLIHDASEAYLSDITRPVKQFLPEYKEIEKHLQNIIYMRFLGTPLSGEESELVDQVDNDMLVCEFDALMKRKVFDDCPAVLGKLSFEWDGFSETESEFLRLYEEISGVGSGHYSLPNQP